MLKCPPGPLNRLRSHCLGRDRRFFAMRAELRLTGLPNTVGPNEFLELLVTHP